MTAARLAVTLLLTSVFSAVRWSRPSASSFSSCRAGALYPLPPVPMTQGRSRDFGRGVAKLGPGALNVRTLKY